MTDPRWLAWTRRIAAIAQNGLTYTEGVFDRERYLELQRIAAEMGAAYTDAEPERVLGLFSVETGYATPKVDVRGVVAEAGRLLLVRERADGLWSLPGGWADVGEAPSATIEKEVLEETGFQVKASRILAVLERERHGAPPLPWSVYKLFFRCDLVGGEPKPSVETAEVGFFARDEIPPLSSGRVTNAQIQRMFEHLDDPSLPTDFD